MFGVGTQEILVILLVVLLLFGGKRIPEIARSLGKGLGDFRRAVNDVQREVDVEILKETTKRDDPRRVADRASPEVRAGSRPEGTGEPASKSSDADPAKPGSKRG